MSGPDKIDMSLSELIELRKHNSNATVTSPLQSESTITGRRFRRQLTPRTSSVKSVTPNTVRRPMGFVSSAQGESTNFQKGTNAGSAMTSGFQLRGQFRRTGPQTLGRTGRRMVERRIMQSNVVTRQANRGRLDRQMYGDNQFEQQTSFSIRRQTPFTQRNTDMMSQRSRTPLGVQVVPRSGFLQQNNRIQLTQPRIQQQQQQQQPGFTSFTQPRFQQQHQQQHQPGFTSFTQPRYQQQSNPRTGTTNTTQQSGLQMKGNQSNINSQRNTFGGNQRSFADRNFARQVETVSRVTTRNAMNRSRVLQMKGNTRRFGNSIPMNVAAVRSTTQGQNMNSYGFQRNTSEYRPMRQ